MQYIADNITPIRCYHRVTPNALSPKGGGSVSEMLLANRILLDNLLQQNDRCGFDSLASNGASLGSSTSSSQLPVSSN